MLDAANWYLKYTELAQFTNLASHMVFELGRPPPFTLGTSIPGVELLDSDILSNLASSTSLDLFRHVLQSLMIETQRLYHGFLRICLSNEAMNWACD